MAVSENTIKICGHGSGNPSVKTMFTYLESRFNQFASNGKRKGIIEVRRVKGGLTKDEQRQFHDTYKTILGRNLYNQSLRDYVYKQYKDKKYYSDCSSSGCATMNKIGKKMSNLNTAGIHSDWEIVPVNIVNGHITNPEILQVGDGLMFVGNDPSRPLQIGHIEYVYEIEGSTKDIEVIECSGEVKITTNKCDYNIRSTPDKSSSSNIVGTYKYGEVVKVIGKSGIFWKTEKGFISRNFTTGWIIEKEGEWYIENGSYPAGVVKTIDGKNYIFDINGWKVTKDRITDNGELI